MTINDVEDLKKVMEEAFPSLTWEKVHTVCLRGKGTARVIVSSLHFGTYSVALTCGQDSEINLTCYGKDPVETLKAAGADCEGTGDAA